MTTHIDTFKDPRQRFYALFSAYEGQLNGQKDNPIHQYRRDAAEQLLKLDFPTTRIEDWKYTSVARLVQQEFALAPELPDDNHGAYTTAVIDTPTIDLNIVNGVWVNKDQVLQSLPEGIHLLSVSDAYDNPRFKALVEVHLLSEIKESGDIFIQMNQAFTRDSLFVYVEEATSIEPVLVIRYTFSDSEHILINGPQVLCVTGKQSRLTILEMFAASNPGFFNVYNRFIVGKGSEVKHYKIQELGKEDFLIYNNIAEQGESSVYTHFNIDLGGRIVRNNISALHKGSNLISNLFGIFPGNDEQHVDTQTFIDHAVPYCESHELYRQVLKDKSRGVFNGKVMVRQDAQKTNAYQQNDTLLVSDRARMDSKPQLEIFADDVRCSHGATIGQLDESAIFYLKSRGLNDAAARFLLEWAFINEVIEKIDREDIKSFIAERSRKKVLAG